MEMTQVTNIPNDEDGDCVPKWGPPPLRSPAAWPAGRSKSRWS